MGGEQRSKSGGTEKGGKQTTLQKYRARRRPNGAFACWLRRKPALAHNNQAYGSPRGYRRRIRQVFPKKRVNGEGTQSISGLAGRRMGKSLCVACPADLNPDSRIADLISTESQAVLIPRILPPEKSGRSVGPLFSRSATHVGKVPQSCLGKLLQSFRTRPFRRSRKLHFIQTIRRFGRHVYL